MIKAIRTALALVVAVMLLAAMTMAQATEKTNTAAAGKTSTKTADQQHHSKLSKAAFWHHDKATAKSAKRTRARWRSAKRATVSRT